jgi:hypothetical protein
LKNAEEYRAEKNQKIQNRSSVFMALTSQKMDKNRLKPPIQPSSIVFSPKSAAEKNYTVSGSG